MIDGVQPRDFLISVGGHHSAVTTFWRELFSNGSQSSSAAPNQATEQECKGVPASDLAEDSTTQETAGDGSSESEGSCSHAGATVATSTGEGKAATEGCGGGTVEAGDTHKIDEEEGKSELVQAFRRAEDKRVIGSSPAEARCEVNIEIPTATASGGVEATFPREVQAGITFNIGTPPTTPRATGAKETPTPPHFTGLAAKASFAEEPPPFPDLAEACREKTTSAPLFPNLAVEAARVGSDENNPEVTPLIKEVAKEAARDEANEDADKWEEWASAQFQKVLTSKTKMVRVQASAAPTVARGAKDKGPKTETRPEIAPEPAKPPGIHEILAGILHLLKNGELTQDAAIAATDAAMKAHGQFGETADDPEANPTS